MNRYIMVLLTVNNEDLDYNNVYTMKSRSTTMEERNSFHDLWCSAGLALHEWLTDRILLIHV
jgi:hypothetical protein